jgi:hypothetical protein
MLIGDFQGLKPLRSDVKWTDVQNPPKYVRSMDFITQVTALPG